MSLKISNLKTRLADAVIVEGVEAQKQILKGVSLEVKPGEVHVLMGPNGSGKSSLAKALLGHYDYEVEDGEIYLDGEDLTESDTTDRALAGLFLAHQYPTEIPGVNLGQFLRLAYNAGKEKEDQLPVFKFRKLLKENLKFVGLPEEFANRNLNEGFSGGEKKKCEVLQMLLLDPKYAILDETDSGLDVDAIKSVFSTISKIINERKELGVIIITHYHRVFDYINPDYVHVFKDGRIVETGGIELAQRVDAEGYL